MFEFICISIVLGMCLFLMYARHGHGGELGRRIRNSDHWALEDAIQEKKDEIDNLECELKCGIYEKNAFKGWRRQEVVYDIEDAKDELAKLEALRPKYPLYEK